MSKKEETKKNRTALDGFREEITKIDAEMAQLFERRMHVSSDIAAYKKANGLPVYDPVREAENLSKGKERVSPEMQEYYQEFLQEVMDLSKKYQRELRGEEEQ